MLRMTSRDRVRASIERRPADRIPFYMWFHPEAAAAIASNLGVARSQVENVLGNDVRQTWVNNNYAMEGIVHELDGEGHIDRWGIGWIRKFGFNQISSFPLKALSERSVLSYRFPDEFLDELIGQMKGIAENRDDCFVGCDVSPCAFEMYWRLRGMDDALLDIAGNPTLAIEMMGRCADFSIALSVAVLERYELDWLWTGDDVASQQGMIISPGQWRDMVKPHLARLFALARSRGLPVAYHCCGALRPIIPDLIEIGCTVLNPIQSRCPGMEAETLKSDFGGDLTFMGGIDTQELLPTATASEVKKATEHLIEVMTIDGGGYILAASHTVPPETPIENVFALYEAAGVTEEEIRDRAADARNTCRS